MHIIMHIIPFMHIMPITLCLEQIIIMRINMNNMNCHTSRIILHILLIIIRNNRYNMIIKQSKFTISVRIMPKSNVNAYDFCQNNFKNNINS